MLPRKPEPEAILSEDGIWKTASSDPSEELLVVHFMCLKPGNPNICPITGYNYVSQQDEEEFCPPCSPMHTPMNRTSGL